MSSSPRAVRQRGLVAHSGLVIALAFACLMAPLVPGLTVRLVFGGLLIAAAGLAILTAPIANHAGARAFRIAWPALTAAAGMMMLGSTYLPERMFGLGLVVYLVSQGAMLFLFASHARRIREAGGPALTFEGLISLGLAALTLVAFPFEQNWILGAIIAVGLLDYASALAFIAMEAALREKALRPS